MAVAGARSPRGGDARPAPPCVNEIPTGLEGGGSHMERVSGWKLFAGIMLMIVGVLNAFDGLVAITQVNYIRRNTGGLLPITNNVKTWGWVELAIGVVIVLAALGVLSGATWARVVGIFVASLNLLFQFAYLGHYP